ncbi:MAG: hypothetical protein KC413_19705 [Anaerolineales bacterium]|nr:hypothetical protein [Anaerolineales bacterium]
MRKPKDGHNYFFVDESGDPAFYNRRGQLIVGKEGCSPILLLGFIETTNPIPLRQAILTLQQEIITDPYFENVPSRQKTAVSFHAKDYLPEIRYRVYQLLATLEFRAQFIVARKIERIFQTRYQSQENLFYDTLISRLFENVLHRHAHNSIYFAKRGSSTRQAPLLQAIQQGVARFEGKWGMPVATHFNIQAQMPKGEPCLSIIDYMNWAIYRAFTRGEMRFYNVISDKVSFLLDLYDTRNYPNNWYSKRNPFHINKITPL